MLSLLLSELVKLDKYNIYMFTDSISRKDFIFHPKVKRVIAYTKRTLIKEYDKKYNISIYVLNNVIVPGKIYSYKYLNNQNKIVIGIIHGAYLASIYSNAWGVYPYFTYSRIYDAFVHVVPDDYYVYKKLKMKNTFFIPNLYTCDPKNTPISNLTYHNLMVMGRENDKIKGGIYAIKAMDLIVKEIPDAYMYFICPDYRIGFIRDLIKELNLTNNIKLLSYVENISKYFLNSSVMLYPSLSESFPMVMNEAKAHGMAIVGFDIAYCFSYQSGIKTVDMLNYKLMAKEAIKLLKDYNARKKLGLEAKMSLNKISNNDTIDKWDKLFSVLINKDKEGYKMLQKYVNEQYYDERKARERLRRNYEFGIKYDRHFECHKFKDIINQEYLNSFSRCRIKN